MTKEEYEDMLMRLDVQRQMALYNSNLTLHAEVLDKMIKLSEGYYEEIKPRRGKRIGSTTKKVLFGGES